LEAFANYVRSNQNGSFTKLYIANHPGNEFPWNDEELMNETIISLQELAEIVNTVNSIQTGLIGGIVVNTHLLDFYSYNETRQAVESVFGPIELAVVDIGCLVSEGEFKSDNEFHSKLSHMIIDMEVNVAVNPMTLADAIVRRCDNYQKVTKLRNMRAKVSCRIAYPSDGKDDNGIPGSLEMFYIFWCRVIENLVDGEVHAQIILSSAFDGILNAFPDDTRTLNITSNKYFNGWWRRTSEF